MVISLRGYIGGVCRSLKKKFCGDNSLRDVLKLFVKSPNEKTDEKKRLTKVCFRLVLLIPLVHVGRKDWNVDMLENIVAELLERCYDTL